jgi:site-specific DNA recombinase
MGAIRSLVHGQQEEMAAALQDTLIHCIAGEKEEVSPIVIDNKIKELETEFDRLLVLAVDENDIIDHKLKQISESILKLKQQKKRIEFSAEHSKAVESKTEEIMNLISAEDLDLTEYSDNLVYRIIERITVLSKDEIRIRFIGGFEITQPLH